mmetsp:Transcript_25072/g.60804  ORF Transcript_25072/g.60804 Transcript_25072/m.60804 type:complete len:222 (-) Transcript_25072:7-672(-)
MPWGGQAQQGGIGGPEWQAEKNDTSNWLGAGLALVPLFLFVLLLVALGTAVRIYTHAAMGSDPLLVLRTQHCDHIPLIITLGPGFRVEVPIPSVEGSVGDGRRGFVVGDQGLPRRLQAFEDLSVKPSIPLGHIAPVLILIMQAVVEVVLPLNGVPPGPLGLVPPPVGVDQRALAVELPLAELALVGHPTGESEGAVALIPFILGSALVGGPTPVRHGCGEL